MSSVWIVVTVLVLTNIFFLMGVGADIVTGYNLMPREEKTKVNPKKYSRATGVQLIFITLPVCLVTFLSQRKLLVLSEKSLIVFGLSFALYIITVIIVGNLLMDQYFFRQEKQ